MYGRTDNKESGKMKGDKKTLGKAAEIVALVVVSLTLFASVAMAVDYTSGDSGTASGGINTGVEQGSSYKYTASIGDNEVSSNAQITPIDVGYLKYMTFDNYTNETWYGIDMNSSLSSSLSLVTKVVDPSSDMANLDVSIEFPSSKVAYAKDFNVSYSTEAGGMILDAKHSGIAVIGIKAEGDVNMTSYVWDNRPIALPKNASDKPFLMALTMADG